LEVSIFIVCLRNNVFGEIFTDITNPIIINVCLVAVGSERAVV
jgi:hypothetical protein